MTMRDTVLQARTAWTVFWKARNRRERSFLIAATAACVIAAVYALLIEPALTKRVSLEKNLPLLRQQAAQMQRLSQQVTQLPAAQPFATGFSRQTVETSLKGLGLTPTEINVSDRTVQLQFASASLAHLLMWMEQVQAERLSVTETDIQTLAGTETVKARVTLIKTSEEMQ
jgi:general secretion pathway protein M